MKRNRRKYPRSPAEVGVGKIREALAEAGTAAEAAARLGVCYETLISHMRRRGIPVTRKGGNRSRFDWGTIERDWRARPERTTVARFAAECGMSPEHFRRKAAELGFYASPPRTGPAAPRRLWRGPAALTVMTPEAKRKAFEALGRIKSRDTAMELVKEERRIHAAAMAAAHARMASRSGAA